MTVRERALITGLSVALIVLTGALIGPSFTPASEAVAPSMPAPRPYVEGVLGHATNASPFGARSAADRDLVALVFRGLVRLGPGDSIVGDLAERWDVDEKGSTWTFHLRSGMRWQDGEPITAEDVVFTIGALSDPDYIGPGAESWREATATAIDALTVSLTLATPLGGFLQAATQPIAPAHLLSFVPAAQLATDAFGRRPVGSGSFRLVALDGSHAVLTAWSPAELDAPGPGANESQAAATDSLGTPGPSGPAAEPAPYLPGIEFDFFDTVDDLRAAWQRGAIDGASGLQPTDARALATTGGARLVRYPGSNLTAVVLNLRTGTSQFGADVNVRKALFEAIDRDAMVSDVLAGLAVRADTLIPPTSPLFDAASSPQVAFDAEAARTALTDAGWTLSDANWVPKGASEPLAFDLLSPEEAANPVAYAIAEIIAQAWQALGLKVTHVAQAPAQPLAERLRNSDYVAAVLPLAVGLDPDLYPILASSQTRKGGSNVSGIQDPALDKLLAAARAPGTDEVRKAAYAALQARLAETLYILPIAFRDDYVVLRNTVLGPTPRRLGTSGDRFWDVLTWRLADGL
ncbi:MAG TPA: peptide ABC transporter substrate-binding protein [Candidatus Eisenbacteria bacterium]|nr:peptide ABC transporter substrate-binding protein [Candidatus Eisenbacteria bacterium]